jgi:hypothetical protein
MPMDDATYVCETDAGSFKLIIPMKALKDAEQLVDILHIESYAVITYEDLNFAGASVRGADCDLRLRPGRCKFNGVGNQIHEDLSQHRRIA